MLKTEAIKSFLLSTGNLHLTKLYSYDMEVQVNVARDGGKRTGGKWQGRRWTGWTDGSVVWKSFRVPFNADSNPNYVDKEINFSLAKHAEAIGMTGWDWKNKKSLWVGFDFDSVVNHESCGLTETELNNIKALVMSTPWVTLVKSTSGKGLHLYVHLEPVTTNNHTEHAALARSILSLLSAEVGHNLNNDVDICGGVLWVYHRKQQGTDGLSLLKEGTKLPLNKIPSNWKDHIDVTSKKRRKILKKKDTEKFENLTASLCETKLAEEHKRLLKWFCDKDKITKQGGHSEEVGLFGDWWWDSDYNMLVCHTLDLVKAHRELNMTGFFHTNSSGSSTQNCFCFPTQGGGWVIRRHGIGTKEHISWEVDPSGWTRTSLNEQPDMEACVRTNKGVENSKGEFVFQDIKSGEEALRNYGISDLEIPEALHWGKRQFYIKEKSDSKILVSMDAFEQDDDEKMNSINFLKNKNRWERVIHKTKPKKEIQAPDYLIRHLISKGAEAGWYIKINGEWISHSKGNVSTVLTSYVTSRDIDVVMGKALLNPWFLVNEPFYPEYPGNRKWNRDATSLSTEPRQGPCESWLSILRHCGSYLDDYVTEDSWCIENGIDSGADYLACWIANMLKNPKEPLPYLFFVGGQNTGKSTLHEALRLLFKNGKGYVRADNALTSKSNFNGELEGSILNVVEETNLTKNREAANRIKDWVTGKTISIRHLYQTSFDVDNTGHWIQCANDISYCPILPGDTRVLVIRVNELRSEIPKATLFRQLEEEKSAFLHYVLSIEIPEPEGRLAMPCLSTSDKQDIESYNSSPLERFISENLFKKKGHTIDFDDFYNKFLLYLSPEERMQWSIQKVGREYPKSYPYCKGRFGDSNKMTLGNVSFDPKSEDLDFEFCFNPHNKRIIKKGASNE